MRLRGIDPEAEKPKISELVSAAIGIFYSLGRDRTYSGEHSLPNLLTNAVIEKSLEKVYNSSHREDLISLICEVDAYYVSKKISAYNEKIKKSGK